MFLNEIIFQKPRRLVKGDKIAIVAPASPVNPRQVALGAEIMKNKGLIPVYGDNVSHLRARGLTSASIQDRLNELIWAWRDDSIRGIFVATGGYGCSELLSDLPYDLMVSTAKPLVGFSDVTALNNAILQKAGLVTFHGPSATVRCDNEQHRQSDSESLNLCLDLLMVAEPWLDKPFALQNYPPLIVSKGRVEGFVIGGNLTTMACLLGTPFFPRTEGAILFLEDVDEGGYEVIRTLTHMANAGVFDSINGIVFGEFTRAPESVDKGDPSIEQVVVEFFKDGPPCIFGMNFSHGDYAITLPIGCQAILDADNAKIFFDQPLA